MWTLHVIRGMWPVCGLEKPPMILKPFKHINLATSTNSTSKRNILGIIPTLHIPFDTPYIALYVSGILETKYAVIRVFTNHRNTEMRITVSHSPTAWIVWMVKSLLWRNKKTRLIQGGTKIMNGLHYSTRGRVHWVLSLASTSKINI